MPFLTEELWHALYNNTPPAKSIALTRFPKPGDPDPAAEHSMTLLQELITTIRVARKDLAMPERQPAETRIHTSAPSFDLVAYTLILQKLAYVSVVSTHPIDATLPRKATANFDVQVLFERTIDPQVESARLTKEIDQLQKAIDNAERQLTNENFLARAPSHVVEAMRTQQTQNSSLLKKKRADLEGLI
jgi:valyl-tRNA synthetase